MYLRRSRAVEKLCQVVDNAYTNCVHSSAYRMYQTLLWRQQGVCKYNNPWQYQTTVTVFGNAIIFSVSSNTAADDSIGQKTSLHCVYILEYLLSLLVRRTNIYLPSLIFLYMLHNKRGICPTVGWGAFLFPFWQTSLPCVINHRVTTVSISRSPLTFMAYKSCKEMTVFQQPFLLT